MPPQEVRFSVEKRKQALRRAKRITRMLQGTMGLEGQGLDRKTLRELTKRTARELLGITDGA